MMSIRNRRPSLRGLRLFCVAARHRSFRVAAEELFVSSSAVSHQIKSLEREFGTALFQRNPQSLDLTDEGARLFAEIDPLIREIDAVTRRFTPHVRHTALRISVQPFFASEMFVPRLSEFTRAHPKIDIHMDTSDEGSERHAADFDVSIRLFRAAPPPDLRSDHLLSPRLVPAASPDFARKWRPDVSEARYEFPIIVHASRPNAWRDWMALAGQGSLRPSNVVKLNSMIAVARAAERGLGAALVPLPLSDAWFQSGGLVRLFDRELPVSGGYYFVCRKKDEGREDVQALRRWMLQAFARDT